MVETDQLEAAKKRHKLREQAQKEKAERRKREKAGKLDFKEENPYDSEEREYKENEEAERKMEEEQEGSELENTYDSEFEAEFFGEKNPELNKQLQNRRDSDESSDGEDQIDSKKQVFNPEDFKDKIEDVNMNLRQFQQFKPADGVDFKQYDRFGFEINDQNKEFITRDGDEVGFEYIPASEEQMKRVQEIQA